MSQYVRLWNAVYSDYSETYPIEISDIERGSCTLNGIRLIGFLFTQYEDDRKKKKFEACTLCNSSLAYLVF